MNDKTENIIDRLFGALSAGDVQAAADCLTADGIIWHGFDRIEQDRAAAIAGWEGFVAHFSDRRFIDIRRQATPTGFVQQHVLTVRTADGRAIAWPICVVVTVRDGLIERLDEYIDRAGTFVPS
ncbi:MAG TPA: nuclear transport factor 2 family protein [Sphingobium sp.]